MNTKLVLNSPTGSVRSWLQEWSRKADHISIAVAFFSDDGLVRQWNDAGKTVRLLVSLRPTTNYFSLARLQDSLSTDLYFLGREFHSKFWIFYKDKKPFAALLGSSNFTNNGLVKNTEANIFIEDDVMLTELDRHFETDLWEAATKLEPPDLREYKKVYLKFLKRKEAEQKDLEKLAKTINTGARSRTVKPRKIARQYLDFWRIVDGIKLQLEPASDKYFPGEPCYLVLDHFWHWVTTVWHKKHNTTLRTRSQQTIIPKLFEQYVKWRSLPENSVYPEQMMRWSRLKFQRYLSLKNIDRLTMPQAVELFGYLHSSTARIQRFDADYSFSKMNTIEKVRKSLKYLLYSAEGIEMRIHNLLFNPHYKLHMLASSGVQEINGWTDPDTYPIRNAKADNALSILGYNFKN